MLFLYFIVTETHVLNFAEGKLPVGFEKRQLSGRRTTHFHPWKKRRSSNQQPQRCDHHWKAVEQYFTVVLFVFQFYPGCILGKFINFGLGTIRNERVKEKVSHSFDSTVKDKPTRLRFKLLTVSPPRSKHWATRNKVCGSHLDWSVAMGCSVV